MVKSRQLWEWRAGYKRARIWGGNAGEMKETRLRGNLIKREHLGEKRSSRVAPQEAGSEEVGPTGNPLLPDADLHTTFLVSSGSGYVTLC